MMQDMEGLPKHVVIFQCPECDAYFQPPQTWIKGPLESQELLNLCLKRLKNLKKFRLVNAEFIPTEPHSKRINLMLTVQKEVLNGAMLEQSHIVEYIVTDRMCKSCSPFLANPDQLVAAVKMRQDASDNCTLLYMDQLILTHDAAKYALRIQTDEGIDFFFDRRSHGVKLVEFLAKVAPIRCRINKRLVFHDPISNNDHFKYTFLVEFCPIFLEDLICLPPNVARSLGNLGPLVICNKLSNTIGLLDPLTLRQGFLDAVQFWSSPFKALVPRAKLVEYVVLEVQAVSSLQGDVGYALADARVARVSDFGKNDVMFNVRTHLGDVLNPGDCALGYELLHGDDIELGKYEGVVLPEVVVIKKSYQPSEMACMADWEGVSMRE